MTNYPDQHAEAALDSGLRACLAMSVAECIAGTKRPVPINDQLAASQAFVMKWNGEVNSTVRGMLALHSIYTCSSRVIQKLLRLADDLQCRIHIHLSETLKEAEEAKIQWGMSPTGYLADQCVLEFPLIAAHCLSKF